MLRAGTQQQRIINSSFTSLMSRLCGFAMISIRIKILIVERNELIKQSIIQNEFHADGHWVRLETMNPSDAGYISMK